MRPKGELRALVAIASRREWIAALEAGASPFDEATLQALRDEADVRRQPAPAQR